LRLLRAHKQGNALFPQVNMGVVGLVGKEILDLGPESLTELFVEVPDMSAFEEVAKTMNARHARYGVRPFEAEDVLNVYKTGIRMSVSAVCQVMGLKILADNPRSLNAATHLLSGRSDEARAARLVFSHVADQLHGREVAAISRQYRQLVSKKAPQSVQNELIRDVVDHMRETWDMSGAPFAAPFWYMEELGDNASRGYVRFGQAVLPSQPAL
jgi:hypothetical protein